jgi:hypothetical protein
MLLLLVYGNATLIELYVYLHRRLQSTLNAAARLISVPPRQFTRV